MSRHRSLTKSIHRVLNSVILTAGLLWAAHANAAATYLKAYAKAAYETSSSVYTVKADSTSIDVVKYYNRYSYAHLAYEGTTKFTVSLKSGATITSFDISPHSYGLNQTATKSGANLTFNLPQVDSRYVIIKTSTSSGALEDLFIAADPEESGVPTIGGKVKDITASPYSADKTGANLVTNTIQNAINDANAAGGGTVYFPAGVYKFSNITLKSDVTLYLASGAVLRGSSNRNDYIWNAPPSAGADPTQGQQNIVIVGNTTNVAIKGRGVIDANSTVLVGGSGDGFGTYRKGIIHTGQSGTSRPNGVVLQDITVKDATTWTLDMEDAKNVTIQNVKMLNDYEWIHSDGYDICATDTALVDNCLAVTGDDALCAKATSTNDLVNVTYSNCVAFSHRGCGTKVGDQARGNANNIQFTNIDAVECQRGMSISHDEGTSTYTNISFTDVRTEKIVGTSNSGEFRVAPFVFWTLSGGAGPVTGVSVVRCSIENASGFKGIIQGTNTNSKVSNVAFEALQVDGVAVSSSNDTSKINAGSNVSNVTFVTGGLYALTCIQSGKDLDTHGGNSNGNQLFQYSPNGQTTQQWTISALSNGSYKLVNKSSGKALDTSGASDSNAVMTQWSDNGGINQQWKITGAANGAFKLTSVESNLVLDDDNSTTDGTSVIQYTDNAGPQQQWRLTRK